MLIIFRKAQLRRRSPNCQCLRAAVFPPIMFPFIGPVRHLVTIETICKMATKLSVEEVLNKVLESNADTNQEQIRSENDDESSNVITLSEKSEPGIPRMLFSFNKNAWKVFIGESYLWLKAIHRRLARGRNIRGPFFSQIRRDIPVEMFWCLDRTIESC